jgi:hypothetical protein
MPCPRGWEITKAFLVIPYRYKHIVRDMMEPLPGIVFSSMMWPVDFMENPI